MTHGSSKVTTRTVDQKTLEIDPLLNPRSQLTYQDLHLAAEQYKIISRNPSKELLQAAAYVHNQHGGTVDTILSVKIYPTATYDRIVEFAHSTLAAHCGPYQDGALHWAQDIAEIGMAFMDESRYQAVTLVLSGRSEMSIVSGRIAYWHVDSMGVEASGNTRLLIGYHPPFTDFVRAGSQSDINNRAEIIRLYDKVHGVWDSYSAEQRSQLSFELPEMKSLREQADDLVLANDIVRPESGDIVALTGGDLAGAIHRAGGGSGILMLGDPVHREGVDWTDSSTRIFTEIR